MEIIRIPASLGCFVDNAYEILSIIQNGKCQINVIYYIIKTIILSVVDRIMPPPPTVSCSNSRNLQIYQIIWQREIKVGDRIKMINRFTLK